MLYAFGCFIVYGACYSYEHELALSIDAKDIYHPVRDMSAGTLSGTVFDAGSASIVSSVAVGPVGYITCTSVGHGLNNGDIVYLIGSSSYDGKFIVANKTDNTFDVAGLFTVTDVCNWYKPSTLKVLADQPSDYYVSYKIVLAGSPLSTDVKAGISYGGVSPITDVESTISECNSTAGSGFIVLSGLDFISLSKGDCIWVQIKNVKHDADLVIHHANVNIHVLG